jgi:uncharacterized membrane protein
MAESNLGSKQINPLLIAVLFLQAAVIITIVFNISVARQVLSFAYLTFVPGFALIRLLRLKIGGLEAVLYMVGLSIVFLMAEGFLLNLLGPLAGIQGPLGLIPVLVASSSFVVISLLLRARDNYEAFQFSMDQKSVVPISIALSGILLLSVIGGILANVSSGTNVILLVMLFSIAILIGVAVFSKKLVPSKFYPVILFGIALALLLQVTLFSKYIVGGDIFGEYALFQNTLSNLHWNSVSPLGYNAMLSVTILPTIYSVVLNLDGTWVFKLVYPLIFAFVPLGVYQLLKRKFDYRVVFFSVFFFVSNITFYTELLQLGRQMIGELFYVLLFITLFSDNVKGFGKWFLFLTFSFGLIVSHYSLAYIFLGSIIVVWLISFWKKRTSQVTLAMILIFAVLTFAWFINVSSGSSFNNFVNAVNNIRANFFSDFFNPQSRSGEVLQAVGVSAAVPTFWHTIGRYVYYITEAFILIGFLGLLIRKKLSFFKDSFNVLISFNILLLGACVVIPNFAGTFNVTRFYHLTLFFLAPLCVLGGFEALKFLSRKKFKEKYLTLIIVFAMLIPFFLFQTGFVYELAKDESVSLPLSGYRFDSMKLTKIGVLSNTEISSASWLSKFRDSNNSVYADLYSESIFNYVGHLGRVDFSSTFAVPSHSYEYLMPYNIDNDTIFISYGSYASVGTINITDVVPTIGEANVIYSSSSCVILQVP